MTYINEDEIISIEYLGEMETIDITTDGDHLFFANDILTHNSSHEDSEFNHSHISGGISKINTADNVLGIFTTAAMKDAGRYQLQFMKTRSSSGVGSKVDLAFNNKSLRIYDLEDGDLGAVMATTTSVMEELKRKSTIRSADKQNISVNPALSITPRDSSPTLDAAAALRAFVKKR